MHVLQETPDECRPLMSRFLHMQFSHDLTAKLCQIMYVLSTSCPLSCLINFRFLDQVQSVLEGEGPTLCLKPDLPEVANLIDLAHAEGQFAELKGLLFHIVGRIRDIHGTDPSTDSATGVVNGYNPEKNGIAYYFTPHGGRIRDLPKYNVSNVHSTSIQCRKYFQDATKSGITYLFLWFDPIIGYCYGFHLISGSEGRKDPHASVFSHMATAPTEIFYDFCCQLEEYALNREPDFWKRTRFYHDTFHAYVHKCPGLAYKSQRVPSLHVGINSEICEQFNSFIQKIKYSARSMNQSHFIFYLQFFIHRWNLMKKDTFEKQKRMAQAFSI